MKKEKAVQLLKVRRYVWSKKLVTRHECTVLANEYKRYGVHTIVRRNDRTHRSGTGDMNVLRECKRYGAEIFRRNDGRHGRHECAP